MNIGAIRVTDPDSKYFGRLGWVHDFSGEFYLVVLKNNEIAWLVRDEFELV